MNEDPELLPRWFGVSVVLLAAFVALIMVVAALVSDGMEAVAGSLLAVACLLVGASAVRGLLWPRRRQALAAGADGVTVIQSPPSVVWPLLLAWLVFLVVAAMWTILAIRDFSALESPGSMFLVVVGAIASLPDFFRLLTGRLHRWELTLSRDGYRYQGYRSDESAPWSKVHDASLQRRGPAGVLIDRKGTGPDVVIPAAAFAVPAEQIVEEIRARLALRP